MECCSSTCIPQPTARGEIPAGGGEDAEIARVYNLKSVDCRVNSANGQNIPLTNNPVPFPAAPLTQVFTGI